MQSYETISKDYVHGRYLHTGMILAGKAGEPHRITNYWIDGEMALFGFTTDTGLSVQGNIYDAGAVYHVVRGEQ